ncbi:MAG: arabinose efflux permease family protein [Naasia sp.]|nr:arabinose efflux permease family protein [Naasia sp.]
MSDSGAGRIQVVTGVFAAALMTATLGLTFLALDAGLDIGMVALLAALSALVQLIARLPLGILLSRVTDRTVILVSVGALATAMIAALVLPGLVGLVLAQAMTGVSRAGFWSASQTHVVRLSRTAARGISGNMLMTGIGNALGPLVAGAAHAVSPTATAWAALALTLLTLLLATGLARLPVFRPERNPEAGRVAFRFGVVLASAAAFGAGIWHVCLTSLAPVVLAGGGWSEFAIGAAVAATNAAFLGGVVLSGRATARAIQLSVAGGGLLVGAGVAALAVATEVPVLAAVALLASGTGAGVLMTLGPALATESVLPEERGHALVVSGTYRAGALLGAPLLVSAATLALPVGAVMAMLGIVAGAPTALAWLLRPKPGSEREPTD